MFLHRRYMQIPVLNGDVARLIKSKFESRYWRHHLKWSCQWRFCSYFSKEITIEDRSISSLENKDLDAILTLTISIRNSKTLPVNQCQSRVSSPDWIFHNDVQTGHDFKSSGFKKQKSDSSNSSIHSKFINLLATPGKFPNVQKKHNTNFFFSSSNIPQWNIDDWEEQGDFVSDFKAHQSAALSRLKTTAFNLIIDL